MNDEIAQLNAAIAQLNAEIAQLKGELEGRNTTFHIKEKGFEAQRKELLAEFEKIHKQLSVTKKREGLYLMFLIGTWLLIGIFFSVIVIGI